MEGEEGARGVWGRCRALGRKSFLSSRLKRKCFFYFSPSLFSSLHLARFAQYDYGGFNTRPRGVFSYIYHDYITAIGAAMVQGQGAHGTEPGYHVGRAVAADTITRGLLPGPFGSDMSANASSAYWRNVSALFFAVTPSVAAFPQFLTLGQERPPLTCAGGACPTVPSYFYRGQPAKPVRVAVNVTAVRIGSFLAPGPEPRALGSVMINILDTPQSVALDLSAMPPALTTLSLYHTNGTRIWQRPRPPQGQPLSLGLGPLGCQMLVGEASV